MILHARWAMVLVTGMLWVGRPAAGQTTESDSTPVMVAPFVEPNQPLDWSLYQSPGACEYAFERTLGTIAFDQRPEVAHHPDTLHTTDWSPIPPSAITVGRQCLAHLPSAKRTETDLQVLLRLAVAINNDTLVDTVVSRQLRQAGSSERARAAVIAHVVHVLMMNHWDAPAGQRNIHRTMDNVQLARRYAAQIQSFGPTALLYKVRVELLLHHGSQNVDYETQLADAQRLRNLIQQVPVRDIPESDRSEIEWVRWGTKIGPAWFRYTHTGTHRDLVEWLAVFDSSRVALDLEKADSVIGHPAFPITGDYVYNAPNGQRKQVVPEKGVVSIITFLNVNFLDQHASWVTDIKRIHQWFPSVHFIFVGLTSPTFGGQNFLDHPEREAELFASFLQDTLRLPGSIVVIKRSYRKVGGGVMLPLPSPTLDGYHVDPRLSSYSQFAIDAQGWVVKDGVDPATDSTLLTTLLARARVRSVDTTGDTARASRQVPEPSTGQTGSSQSDGSDTAGGNIDVYGIAFIAKWFFRGMQLTTPQRDSIQTLLAVQKVNGKIAFKQNIDRVNAIWDKAAREAAKKAYKVKWEGIRKTNRKQLRAVLTSAQQTQFDRNVHDYDAKVDTVGVRVSPWW